MQQGANTGQVRKHEKNSMSPHNYCDVIQELVSKFKFKWLHFFPKVSSVASFLEHSSIEGSVPQSRQNILQSATFTQALVKTIGLSMGKVNHNLC